MAARKKHRPSGPAVGKGRKAVPAKPKPGAQYFRGNQHAAFYGWQPVLREASDDVRAAWADAAARSIDGMQNSGWLSGIVESSVSQQVGTGLKLNSKPDFDVLGWSQPAAAEWARMVERRFDAWANDPVECDAAETMTLGDMCAAAVRCHFAYGEVVATLPLITRPWATTKTKVKMLLPTRLCQRSEPMYRLEQGVYTDRYGAPIGYLFRNKSRFGYETEERADARYPNGGRFVIHAFDGMPGQRRGISPFAPVLRVLRQYDQLADATLTAAMVQTIFAATIKSSLGSKDAFEGMLDKSEELPDGTIENDEISDLIELRGQWYRNTKIDLGLHGRVAHLFPDDELVFHKSEHPNTAYESFAKGLMREVARCAGVTYEDATGDYAGATYSSVRMATSLAWPIVMRRRKVIPARLCQGAFEAWLDGEIETGRIPFPGGYEAFLANWSAATRAEWRGPAKPQADDVKASKAHDTWSKMGVMSDEMICADLGADVDDVYEQRAREKQRRKELGIDDKPILGDAPPSGNNDDEEDKRDDDREAA